MKQLAFIIISSTPSFENSCTNFKPLYLTEPPCFHLFLISTLRENRHCDTWDLASTANVKKGLMGFWRQEI